ncbi:hypothetical protein [Halomonas caseinilytica]|uniref:hypothetical protein n=1 Tax=Halomonas caseinilytica TaxID=438744 RepID=UPI000848D878|nr:hypothetical protein [Halomonas caseinilytica]
MIHWLELNLHLPYFVPTLGTLAAWLVVGNSVLVWTAVTTAFNRRRGYAPNIAKDSAAFGLLATAILVVAWPIVVCLQVREVIRRRVAA